MIRRKLYFYNVLQKEKNTRHLFFCKVVDDNSAVFPSKKRLERNTVLRKKMIITQFLMLFFLRGQKLDSLVWYDLGGPTNYVKIRISVVIVMLFVF